MDTPQLPTIVWEFIITWVPRVCTTVGMIVIIYWWKKGKLPAMIVASRHHTHATPQQEQRQGRRLDDKMIERMLNSQDKMADAFNNLAESIREQGKGFFVELRESSKVVAQGFRDMHERFDEHIGKIRS